MKLGRLGLSLQVHLQHLVQLSVIEKRRKWKISRCIDRRLNLPSQIRQGSLYIHKLWNCQHSRVEGRGNRGETLKQLGYSSVTRRRLMAGLGLSLLFLAQSLVSLVDLRQAVIRQFAMFSQSRPDYCSLCFFVPVRRQVFGIIGALVRSYSEFG